MVAAAPDRLCSLQDVEGRGRNARATSLRDLWHRRPARALFNGARARVNIMHHRAKSLSQVILSEAKDLVRQERLRSCAALRMTASGHRSMRWCIMFEAARAAWVPGNTGW